MVFVSSCCWPPDGGLARDERQHRMSGAGCRTSGSALRPWNFEADDSMILGGDDRRAKASGRKGRFHNAPLNDLTNASSRLYPWIVTVLALMLWCVTGCNFGTPGVRQSQLTGPSRSRSASARASTIASFHERTSSTIATARSALPARCLAPSIIPPRIIESRLEIHGRSADLSPATLLRTSGVAVRHARNPPSERPAT